MDEQPLDRDAIRRLHARNVKGYCMTCEGDETGCDIPALLDLLEQTERERDDNVAIAVSNAKQRDIFNETISRVQTERDVARGERNEARDDSARWETLFKGSDERLARLTEERAYYRQMADEKGQIIFDIVLTREAAKARVFQLQTALQSLLNVAPSVLHKTCRYDGCIYCRAREALAAVPVVPDPPTSCLPHVTDHAWISYDDGAVCMNCGTKSKAYRAPISYTDKDE